MELAYIRYMSFIEQCRRENVCGIRGYVENHHIIPFFLGGNNFYDNMIPLTVLQHHRAHVLLHEYVASYVKKDSNVYKYSQQAVEACGYRALNILLKV